MENIANNAASTLSASLTSTATTLTVASAASFPAANFRVKIDNEIILVTGISGTTFTVTRGAEGTTAATHASGAGITHILTAGGLTAFVTQNSGAGPTTTLTSSSFTWLNQNGATLTNGSGSLLLTVPSATSSPANEFQWAYRSLSGLTSVEIAADVFYPLFSGTNVQFWGFGFLESTTNKSLWIGPSGQAATAQPFWINSAQLVNYTAAEVAESYVPTSDRMYLRIRNDGTNLYFDVSKDQGISYGTIYSEAISAGHFTSAPDSWCFGGINYAGATTWPPLLLNLRACTEA